MKHKTLLCLFSLSLFNSTSAMFMCGPGPSDEFPSFLRKKGVTLHGALCRIARLYNSEKITYGDAWDMVFESNKFFLPEGSVFYSAMQTALTTKNIEKSKRPALLQIAAACIPKNSFCHIA